MTVVIAAYNEEEHIAECIESLCGQSYAPIEIIVVDDGSTDRTAGLARQFGSVRVLSQQHQGKARAVNRGGAEAAGEILIFADGDMFFERDYVARMIAPIVAGRAVGTCHTDEYVANRDNVWSRCLQARSGLPSDRRLSLDGSQVEEGSTVFRAIRRDRFLEVAGFEDVGYWDDQTIYPKLNEKAEFVRATCYHHNPGTLREVFLSGRWGGKSIALRYGVRSGIRFLPVLSFVRAVRAGVRLGSLPTVWYQLVYEAGILSGILCVMMGTERKYAK